MWRSPPTTSLRRSRSPFASSSRRCATCSRRPRPSWPRTSSTAASCCPVEGRCCAGSIATSRCTPASRRSLRTIRRRRWSGAPAWRSRIGLQLVVDGVGLERPRAGVGVYTTQILHAMHVDRPDCRLTVFGPSGGFVHVPYATYRPLPRTRLIGRHLQGPARIRQLKPDAYFGPAGALPLGDVGCPSVITIHDLAIYRNAGWFPARHPLSTRIVAPPSVMRADVSIAVSESTAHDVFYVFGIPRSRIG